MKLSNIIWTFAGLAVLIFVGWLFYYLFFQASSILTSDVTQVRQEEERERARAEKLALVNDRVDPLSFRFLEHDSYAKDDSTVYYFSGSPITESVVEDANVPNFKSLNYYFGTDGTNIYFQDKVLEGFDPDTFEALSDTYVTDGESVYVVTVDEEGNITLEEVEGADPDTFIVPEDEESDTDSSGAGESTDDSTEGGSSEDSGATDEDVIVFDEETTEEEGGAGAEETEKNKILDGTIEGSFCGEVGGEREYCITP